MTSQKDSTEGAQTVIAGAEGISEREVAERRMLGRKRPDAGQRSIVGVPLFDPQKQTELF